MIGFMDILQSQKPIYEIPEVHVIAAGDIFTI
jgi:hypothetical protein